MNAKSAKPFWVPHKYLCKCAGVEKNCEKGLVDILLKNSTSRLTNKIICIIFHALNYALLGSDVIKPPIWKVWGETLVMPRVFRSVARLNDIRGMLGSISLEPTMAGLSLPKYRMECATKLNFRFKHFYSTALIHSFHLISINKRSHCLLPTSASYPPFTISIAIFGIVSERSHWLKVT